MRKLAGLSLALLLYGIEIAPALSHDLIPRDIDTIRVSACDHQVRFKVELAEGGHAHVSGKSGLVESDYRITVYSTSRNKLLTIFDVSGHKMGDTLQFVVPSSKLICDNSIEIRIDDQNKVTETKEKNNSVIEKWQPPEKSGLDDPCMIGRRLDAEHVIRGHMCP